MNKHHTTTMIIFTFTHPHEEAAERARSGRRVLQAAECPIEPATN
jgi:hypothetical protein